MKNKHNQKKDESLHCIRVSEAAYVKSIFSIKISKSKVDLINSMLRRQNPRQSFVKDST